MDKWRLVEYEILKYIEHKKLFEGNKLPRDLYFSKICSCSLQPVIRAMTELERKGVLKRSAGAPTKVLSRQVITLDREYSFGYKAQTEYSHELRTEIIELSIRLPIPGELEEYELMAQKYLGLKKMESFYVIGRLRIIDNEPRVIHRSYLNPAYFKENFLRKHDFVKESMIDIFNQNDYRINSRNTILRARFPRSNECDILNIRQEPILEVVQELSATRVSTQEVVPIEYMVGSYTKWEYKIFNR